MSLSDLASIASSVAVIGTLVFLALQVRQANRNQRSLMQQGRSARTVDILLRMTDQKLSETVMRALKGDPATSEAEYIVLYGFATAIFWNYEDSFMQFRSGTLDAQSWESDVTTFKALLGNPLYRAAWRIVRGSLGDGYRQFVDGLMGDVGSAPGRNVSTLLSQYLAEEIAASRKPAA
jgi:hypothetical protein